MANYTSFIATRVGPASEVGHDTFASAVLRYAILVEECKGVRGTEARVMSHCNDEYGLTDDEQEVLELI